MTFRQQAMVLKWNKAAMHGLDKFIPIITDLKRGPGEKNYLVQHPRTLQDSNTMRREIANRKDRVPLKDGCPIQFSLDSEAF